MLSYLQKISVKFLFDSVQYFNSNYLKKLFAPYLYFKLRKSYYTFIHLISILDAFVNREIIFLVFLTDCCFKPGRQLLLLLRQYILHLVPERSLPVSYITIQNSQCANFKNERKPRHEYKFFRRVLQRV